MDTSHRNVIDRFYKAFSERRFADVEQLLHPDAVQEWPQSGERFRGSRSIRAVMERFPDLPDVDKTRVVGAGDRYVLSPSFTLMRITGTGDVYTVESRVTYPNGETWHGIAIFEFRDGRIVKMTDYFAPPFAPADWRAEWAEGGVAKDSG